MSKNDRGYADLHDHLAALRERGLLVEVDRPIDKDAEMHPLVFFDAADILPAHQRVHFRILVDGPVHFDQQAAPAQRIEVVMQVRVAAIVVAHAVAGLR